MWAGQVNCVVEVTRTDTGVHQMVILIQPGLTGEESTQTFDGHSIDFLVTPYPEAGKPIAKDDYRLTLSVNPSY